MPDAPSRRDALAGIAKPGRYGRAEGPPGLVATIVEERVLAAIAAFAGREADVCTAIVEVLGMAPVDRPMALRHGSCTVIGRGPGRWLAIGDGATARGLPERLRQALVGLAAVTDQSDALMSLRLSGPHLRDVLAKGVAVDLDPATFPPGAVASTLVAYVPMTLVAHEAAATIDLMFPRSLAGSAWRWLQTSAAAHGCELRRGPAQSTDHRA